MTDGFPVVTPVSEYALGIDGIRPTSEALVRRTTAGLCSGWRSAGMIMVSIEREA